MINQLKMSEPIFGDHKLITFVLPRIEKTNQSNETRKRTWLKYSKERLLEKLSTEDWNSTRTDVQSYFNWMETKLINIVDTLAPFQLTSNKHKTHQSNEQITRLINKKRKHLKNKKQLSLHLFSFNIISNFNCQSSSSVPIHIIHITTS